MYCVRCGVRLEAGTERCPLCRTPVWNPEPEGQESPHYNRQLYPPRDYGQRYLLLSILTALLVSGALACLIVCLALHHAAAWSGYVMLGAALLYILVLLPLWFRRAHPVVFLPVDSAAIGGFLLYVCLKTGGKWFLSFAFPCVVLCFVVCYFVMWLCLLKMSAHVRLMLVGVLFVMLGGFTMLMELFAHLTFGSAMFLWSPYTAGVFALTGLFLFVSSFIRPWRHYLAKKFFF